MKRILLAVFVWLILLNLVNVVSSRLIFDKTSYELPKGVSLSMRHLTVPWANFDGRNYLKIVLDGYDPNYYLDLKVFFPAYPLLIRILSFNLSLNPVVAGLFASLMFFVAALVMIDKVLSIDKTKANERYRTILLILAFPTSFFFVSLYTESLFLFLAVTSFYFMRKRNFVLASIFVAIATATRITGLALIPPLLWESYIAYREKGRIPWWVLVSPLGLAFYGAYLYSISGEFFAFMVGQNHWNRSIGLLSPYNAFKEGLANALYGSQITRHDFIGRSMEVFEVAFAMLFVALLAISFRKIRFLYWLYGVGCAIPVFFSGILSSVHRYIIVVFPLFFFLVKSMPKKYFYAWLTISSILLAYMAALFLRGYWVA